MAQTEKEIRLEQKLDLGLERKERALEQTRQKAKTEYMKAHELAFLATLEKESKKWSIDIKLKETHRRRLELLKSIKVRQQEMKMGAEQTVIRREALIQEKEQMLQQKWEKNVEAGERRTNILEERANKARSKIVSKVNKDKETQLMKESFCSPGGNGRKMNSKETAIFKMRQTKVYLDQLMSRGKVPVKDCE